MSRNKIGLVLAAAAAYGIYRYSKLTPEQKNGLITKGKDFVNKNLGGLKNAAKKASPTVTENGF